MAEEKKQSIVERIMAGQDPAWQQFKTGSKVLAGQAYKNVATLVGLPAQLGIAAMQLPGVLFRGDSFNIPDPTRQMRQSFERTTGIPVDNVPPGYEVAADFARGATLGPTVGAGLAGGITSAVVGQTNLSPAAKVAAEGLIPALAVRGGRGLASSRAPLSTVDNTRSELPLTKGETSGNPVLLQAEADLAVRGQTAEKMQAFEKARAAKAEQIVRKFTDVAKSDARGGADAAEAFDSFLKSQANRHNRLKEVEFGKALSMSKRPMVDLTPVKEALVEIMKRRAGVGAGADSEAIARKAMEDYQKMMGFKTTRLQDAQFRLEELGKDGFFGKDISPGSAAQDQKMLREAWEQALENTSRNPKIPANEREAARRLIEARANFSTRMADLEETRKTALSMFFDNKGEKMQPDQIMARLRGMKQGERDFYVSVMSMYDQSQVEQLRRSVFNNMIEKAQVKGGAANQPGFSIQNFVKQVDALDENELKFLIPDKDARDAFSVRMAEFKKAMNSARVNDPDYLPQLAGNFARLTAGRTGVGGLTDVGIRMVENLTNNPSKLYDLLVEPSKGYDPTLTGRLRRLADEMSTTNNFGANRERATAIGVGQANQTPAEPAPEVPDLPMDFLQPQGSPESTLPDLPNDFMSIGTSSPNVGSTEQQTMRVDPNTQRDRDAIRKSILEEELLKATTPEAKASIERELMRMQ